MSKLLDLSIDPFIHTLIHWSIHRSIHWSIDPFIHAFIHPLIHSLIRSFLHRSIHPSIHPFIVNQTGIWFGCWQHRRSHIDIILRNRHEFAHWYLDPSVRHATGSWHNERYSAKDLESHLLSRVPGIYKKKYIYIYIYISVTAWTLNK